MIITAYLRTDWASNPKSKKNDFSAYIDGESVHAENTDHPFFSFDDRRPLAVEALTAVEFFTSRQDFVTFAVRTQGAYRLGKAEATLTLTDVPLVSREDFSFQENLRYVVQLKSTDHNDLVNLYLGIRTGTLKPAQSWDEEQVGVKDLNVSTLASVARFIRGIEGRITELEGANKTLREELGKSER